jgi:hypothetical protein
MASAGSLRPEINVGSPTAVDTDRECFIRLFALYLTNALPEGQVFLRDYKDIFIKVKERGAFKSSDVEGNSIHICGDDGTPVPDFVAEFERELQSKAGLAPDTCCFPDYSFDANGSM